ncbi:MAG: WbqC family protein [Actinomycetia bacterium]|nr:WbqC family protein [Actinomycetes bacterium]
MMAERIFAIHQPNYVPWLGYFYKVANSDIFIILDQVQFPRGRSFSSRNRIKTPNGPTYLTIPVKVPSGNEGRANYTEVTFADEKWKTKHVKSVELAYKRAPFFDEVFTLYQRALESNESLVELNVALIRAIMEYLSIDTELVMLSDLLSDPNAKPDLIVDGGNAVGGPIYLSGTGGGRQYNDKELLRRNGIDLAYSAYESAEYTQLWGDFEPDLSILDALFNCGPSTSEFLKG